MVGSPTLTALLVACSGLGTMPPEISLAAIPQIWQPRGGQDDRGHNPHGKGGAPGSSGTLARDSVAAMMANLLPQATPGQANVSPGVYVGEGLPPVPMKIAVKIRRGEFIDMGELLPKFWAPPWENDPQTKSEAKTRQARLVQDIFRWIQCFGTYVSVMAPLHPERVPELMAYQAMIVRASQDYAGLAWVHYDSAFRRQPWQSWHIGQLTTPRFTHVLPGRQGQSPAVSFVSRLPV